MDYELKLLFTKIISSIKDFNLKKSSGAPIFHIYIMSMVGYYNEFTVVKRKIVFKLLVKENSDYHYFSHDQFMPMSLNVLSIFKVTLIILRHYFSIEKVIDMEYT